jgi:hypothetical protein
MHAIRRDRQDARQWFAATYRFGRRAMTALAAVVALIPFAFGIDQDAAGGGDGRRLRSQEQRLVDVAGSIHRPFDDPQVRAAALVFILPDRPISSAYLPELNRQHSVYRQRGAPVPKNESSIFPRWRVRHTDCFWHSATGFPAGSSAATAMREIFPGKGSAPSAERNGK